MIPSIEAWALISLAEHPGRAEVAPFIRGNEAEEPQTTVAWRADVPYLARLPAKTIERALEAIPLQPVELLDAPTREVVDMLRRRIAAIRKGWERAKAAGESVEEEPKRALLVRRRNQVDAGWILPAEFQLGEKPLEPDDRALTAALSGATLFLEPAIGGLDGDGNLADRGPPDTLDDTDDEHRSRRPMHVEPKMLIRIALAAAPQNGTARFKVLSIPSGWREADPEIAAKAARVEQLGYRRNWSCRLPPGSGDEDAEGDLLEYWSQRWDPDGETAAAKPAANPGRAPQMRGNRNAPRRDGAGSG